MSDPPRYVFHPLERRGLVLGLSSGQLVATGIGVVVAVALRSDVGGGVGTLLAVVVAGSTGAAALWSHGHRPVGVWALLRAQWAARRVGGPVLDDLPVAGPGRCRAATPPGIRLVTAGHSGGEPPSSPVGFVSDRRNGTLAGVLPVGGGAFCLLDPAGQAGQLEAWRRVLGALARPGSPVLRVQWVHRVAAAGPPPPAPAAGGAAGESYRRLVDGVWPTTREPATWLVVVVGARTGAGGPHALLRELRLLSGQLRAAGLDPGPPLERSGLASVLAAPHRPGGAPTAGRSTAAGPLASDDRWAVLRTDGSWHCTYWVAEWPRTAVGPDFLTPLLVGLDRASLSVVMAPVDPERALRQARSSRASDLADAQLRARAGFLPSARRQRESDGAVQLEEELTEGHSEFRFSAYLSVSADDREGLVTACGQAEHAAQAARVELRRLYGRQAEAFTWTQPLGRGLR